MESHKLMINPRTKVLQLIETYPQLEDVMINFVPAFKKLKNPVLRRTVARVVTLQQAAAIGNVKVEELVNLLRKEVGQDTIESAEEAVYNTEKPEWFDPSEVKIELDIREMLDAGEHPVNQVISDLRKLQPGEIFHLIAPFVPIPLIDKTISLDIDHWIDQQKEGLYSVYFTKYGKTADQ